MLLELSLLATAVVPVVLYLTGHKSGAKEVVSAEKSTVSGAASAVEAIVAEVSKPAAVAPVDPVAPTEPPIA